MEQNLFQRIGGKEAVDAAVNIFYKKNLLDERVRHYFLEIDLNRLKSHQVLFLTYVFGGVEHYNGRSLWDAHKNLVDNLGLGDVHFDAVAENLQATLDELNVPADIAGEVMELVASTREQVLRGEAA